MHLLQLLKGWLFIAVTLAALFFMGFAMERRHQKAKLNQQPQVAVLEESSQKIPDNSNSKETPTVPAPNVTGPESWKSEPLETKVSSEDRTSHEPGSEPDVSEPSHLEPSPEKTIQEQQTEASSPESLVSSPNDSGSTLQGNSKPEATQFVPVPFDLPLLKEKSSSPFNPVTPPHQQTKAIPTTCPPFPNLKEAEGRSTDILENQAMLAWKNAGAQPVSAIQSGSIARIHQSPHYGLTVYIISEDGRNCLLYGHLEALLPGMVAGAPLSCGTPFAVASAKNTVPNLVIQAMALLPGQAWWQGTPIEPDQAFPQWLPPEPEEREDL